MIKIFYLFCTYHIYSQAFQPLFFLLTFYFIKKVFFGCVGLRCCTGAFSSCGERGLLFLAVRGLLTAVASLVEEHGL